MALVKTAVKTRTATFVYAVLAVTAVATATAVGYSILSGGLPGAATNANSPDLEIRSGQVMDTATLKVTLKFCNNGLSLYQYYNSTISAFVLQWFTYDASGNESKTNAVSLGGRAVSLMSNGTCADLNNWAMPLTAQQQAEYAANKRIVFKIDPSNGVAEADETNNNIICQDAACPPTSTPEGVPN